MTLLADINVEAVVIFAIVLSITLGITYWASGRASSAVGFYSAGRQITGRDTGLDEYVVDPLLVNPRRVGCERNVDVPHRRMLFEFDRAGLGDVLGLGACRCDADRDHFSNEPNLALRQRRILGMLETLRGAVGDDRLQRREIS